MDKISIVVAVYNAENYIKKCIDSLLNQTYSDTEIILVNDCSKDNSLNICNEYSSQYKNVIVVNNEQNIGVSAVRNKGIDRATGKYIAFVDSDDYVEENYLEMLYYALTSNDVMLSICGCMFHDVAHNKPPYNYLWDSSGDTQVLSMKYGFEMKSKFLLNTLWNKLFIKELIDRKNIRFDTNLSLGEDFRFALDYIYENDIENVAMISLPLYHYFRYNDQSLMSTQKLNDKEELSNIERLYNIVKKYNPLAQSLYENEIKIYKSYVVYSIINSSLKNKEKYASIKEHFPEYKYKDFLKQKIIKAKNDLLNH